MASMVRGPFSSLLAWSNEAKGGRPLAPKASPWPLVTTRGHQISSAHAFPSPEGELFHSSMHPILKVAGVVHIWYDIPLGTTFAQQFNGDVFRAQFHLYKSRSQNPTPILKEDFLTHQSGNPWRQSEDHSRIPITWPYRS
ncbi:hypothetical protein O181_092725 [Austropuccinia psidii MF-1]|uniref:Uncharacterized protein n=1 Tax=Austropuccinia psidii MF-1 TaxID=1389203 RepID=A0A9Q3P9F2_9BASI|nr:hypothetical protein [Austropuccinia psidii MF-1]